MSDAISNSQKRFLHTNARKSQVPILILFDKPQTEKNSKFDKIEKIADKKSKMK